MCAEQMFDSSAKNRCSENAACAEQMYEVVNLLN